MNKKENYPLILVFYLDSELMRNKDIILPFTEAVNQTLAIKNANAIAFFIPTKGEERVDCINPKIIEPTDMEKINKMVEEIKLNFSIAPDMDIPNEEITTDSKPCECGDNPDGNCKCE